MSDELTDYRGKLEEELMKGAHRSGDVVPIT